MQSTLFRLDPETHKALRIASIEAGVSMNEVLTKIVEEWLVTRGWSKWEIEGRPAGEKQWLKEKKRSLVKK